MEIKFEWNEKTSRLTRQPDSPVATREESMKFATWTRDLRGDDPVARDLAKYEMAKLAYEQREWYQPCKALPGVPRPVFLNDANAMASVANGLRILGTLTTVREVEVACEKSSDVSRAVSFSQYVRCVSTVEEYNRGSCGALLMAHAWLTALNPEGDAAAIALLRGLIREWYGIRDPGTSSAERAGQAVMASKNLGWLSSAWRRIWMHP